MLVIKTEKQRIFWIIGSSLFFAALMVFSENIFPTSWDHTTINFSLIALWYIPFTFFAHKETETPENS